MALSAHYAFLLAIGISGASDKSRLIGLWKLNIQWDLSNCISDDITVPINSFLLFDSTWINMVFIEKSENSKEEIKREFAGKWKLENDSELTVMRAWYSVDSGNWSSSTSLDHNNSVKFRIEKDSKHLIIYGENFAPTLGKICEYKSIYEKKESKVDSAIHNRSYKKYLEK